MIRKLLYRFRRLVLVWRRRIFQFMMNTTARFHYFAFDKVQKTNVKLTKLDASEMSKGEAYVIVR